MSILTVTNLNDDGSAGSLRQQIAAAASGDIITFDPTLAGGTLVLVQGNGHLTITKDVTIDGDLDNDGTPDIIIDGQDATRLFFLDSGDVTLQGLVLINGRSQGGDGGGTQTMSGGGGLGAGGAVFVNSQADLRLENMTFGAGTCNGNQAIGGNSPGPYSGSGMGGSGGGGLDGFAGISATGHDSSGSSGGTGGGPNGGPGGANPNPGSAGGFGGGGGGGNTGNAPLGRGQGGFAGGGASGPIGYHGGGGGGLGGSVFVMDGASVTIAGNVTFENGVAQGGTGGANNNGSGFGSGIFLVTNGGTAPTLTFDSGTGDVQTINDDIADQTGSGGTGADAGSVGIVKNGAGTLILAGNNTFSGPTIVNAGTLQVDGSIANSALTLNGGTLAGDGTFGDVTLSNTTLSGSGTFGDITSLGGVTIAPGHSPGIMNVGSTTLTGTDSVDIQIGGTDAATPQFDQLNVTGTLDLGGATLNVSFIDDFVTPPPSYQPGLHDRFQIITNDDTDAVTGTFNGLPEGTVFTISGVPLVISYVGGTGNDVVLAQATETFVVTTLDDELDARDTNLATADFSDLSLREALTLANSLPGAASIGFAVAGTIALTIALPIATDAVAIDGTSAPGFSGAPLVSIDGAGAGAGVDGLTFDSGGSGSTVKGLAIVNFDGNGIKLDGASTVTITGNYIGVDQDGITAAANGSDGILITNGATGNTIGGTASGDGNIISGNQTNGVEINGADTNTVSGNFVGTDVTGTVALPNGGDGILIANGSTDNTIGGSGTGEGNLISGNGESGVEINDADANTVSGNVVGLDVSATTTLGNVGAGVSVISAFNNAIHANAIANNAIGIDLNGDGVTPNDAGDGDSGANDLQNFPVFSLAGTSGSQVDLRGTLNSTANHSFTIEFFASTGTDTNGNVEGARFLGSASVTTDGNGDGSFNEVLAASVTAGEFITATATDDTTGNTSEFSQALTARAPETPSLVVTTLQDVVDAYDDQISLREALVLAQQDPLSADTITFAQNLVGGPHPGVDDGHLTLTQGELFIAGNVTIDGNVPGGGITIDADGASRVFIIDSGTVTLNALTMTGGEATCGCDPGYGGAVSIGAYYFGGYANVTISNSTLSNSTAVYGGGISVDTGSALSLINSTVSGNTADIGGGIAVNYGATLATLETTISDNHVTGGLYNYGGGIAVNEGGNATLTNTTISGNTGYAGGGIYNAGYLTLTNVTVANNTAVHGGGLYNAACGCGDAKIYNATFTGNFASAIGGGIYNANGAVALANSIVAGNGAGYGGPDIATTAGITSYSGVNIFSQAGAGQTGVDVYVSNLADIFAVLTTIDPDATPNTGDEFSAGLLANNGGPTQTVALARLSTNPALDAADSSAPATDQRGDARDDLTTVPNVSGTSADIGAYELQNAPPVANPDSYQVDEDHVLTVAAASGVLHNDSDADIEHDPLSAIVVDGPLHGLLALNPDGSFTYTPDANYSGPDAFTYKANDGLDDSASATVDLTVNAVNDPPSLAGLGDTVNYTEGAAAAALDGNHNASISDAELDISASHYAGALLTLARHGGANSDDIFSGNGSGAGQLDLAHNNAFGENVSLDGGATFIGSFTQPGDGTFAIAFNASATAAAIDSVLRQIAYSNSSENPPTSVVIDFAFSDGNGQPGGQNQGAGAAPGTATASTTVQITQVDSAPVLVSVAPAAAYGIGTAGATLSPALGVFDVDATPPSLLTGLASAAIAIVNGFLPTDQLFVNLATSGGHFITPDGDTTNVSVQSSNAHTLSLAGQDTLSHWQSVLDAVSYKSTAADPSNGGVSTQRTITWTVNDGALDSQPPNTDPNNLVNTTILHFDAAPTVDLDAGTPGTGFETTYTENAAAVRVVDTDVSISDFDTAAMVSATVVLANAKPGDSLSIAGGLSGGIESFIDTSVAGTITVRLVGSAPLSDYEAALEQIGFANSSENPDAADRDITIVVSDGEVDSNIAHTTVHVVPVNDAPVAQDGAASGNEDTVITGTLVASDVDSASLTFSRVSNAAHGTVTVNPDGTFSYTPNADFNGTDSFTFLANDGLADSNVATVSLTVNPVNDAPAIGSDGGGDTASVSVLERTTGVTTVVATDPDGPSLSYSIAGGADAAKFQIDAATGALSFITAPNFDVAADADHNNSYIVQVRASDGSLTDDQTITVNVANDPNVTSTVHWTKSVDPGAHPPGWLPAGNGDFNGDGTTDLAWFNATTGDIDIWKLQNGAWAGSSDVGSHPPGYQPVGFADYNGDHTSDVLWFNPATRDVDLWKISNGQWAGSVDIGTHPAGFTPALSGDFTGDGTSDIAWYNPTTNAIDIWKLANGQWAGSVDVGSHPAGYTPVLAGDFNGDGTSDIAWFNPATGDLDIWKLSNGQWAGSIDVGQHPAGYQPFGAADFNLDGTTDIAWYNPTNNDIDIWVLKNGQWSASFDIGQHPGIAPAAAIGNPSSPGGGSPGAAPFAVIAIGVGDFDHSGVGDIMWRDTGTGHLDNWLLAYS